MTIYTHPVADIVTLVARQLQTHTHTHTHIGTFMAQVHHTQYGAD